jgi:hypothetical protein
MWAFVRKSLVCSGIAAWGSVAGASVILPASLPELAADADGVVYARVAGIEVRQAPRSLRVERLVTLHVLRSAKGSWPAVLTIAVPGGTFGRYRTIVPGAPSLVEGDEALVFFRQRGTEPPRIIGLSQGLVRVRVDPVSGARTVLPPPDAKAGPIVRGDPARTAVTLEEFEGRLAGLVLNAAAGRAGGRR